MKKVRNQLEAKLDSYGRTLLCVISSVVAVAQCRRNEFMTNRRRNVVSICVALLTMFTVTPAHANVVYSNGPVDNIYSAWYVANDWAVSDSFVVGSATNLTSITGAGLWTNLGTSPISLNWAIGTSMFASDISSGVSPLTNTKFSSNSLFDIWDSSFAIHGSLGPGVSYLTLSHASAGNGQSAVYWGQGGGSSVAYQKNLTSGNIYSAHGESFTINGVNSVPEPSSFGLVSVGACLAAIATAKRGWQNKAGD